MKYYDTIPCRNVIFVTFICRTICGRRLRVKHAYPYNTGGGRSSSNYGPPRSRRDSYGSRRDSYSSSRRR